MWVGLVGGRGGRRKKEAVGGAGGWERRRWKKEEVGVAAIFGGRPEFGYGHRFLSERLPLMALLTTPQKKKKKKKQKKETNKTTHDDNDNERTSRKASRLFNNSFTKDTGAAFCVWSWNDRSRTVAVPGPVRVVVVPVVYFWNAPVFCRRRYRRRALARRFLFSAAPFAYRVLPSFTEF